MAAIPKLCYEIFVRSFCDSNGDGIGDLPGITARLDYLQQLGVDAIWLTPIHPSPSYHKYDVTDYCDIDPEFGSLADFRVLIHEAHKRNISILLDLIINHTSTQHPWFMEAKQDRDSPFRGYYWWKTQEEIDRLGIASRKASEDSQEVYPWHEIPGDQEMYYGLFYSGMPDLNFHSTALRAEFVKIMRFWLLEMEVDGFRIDAARHIYPTWEREHHSAFWTFFKETVQQIKPGAFTVGEIWASSEEIAPYFQGLHATFNFDLSFGIQEMLLTQQNDGIVERLILAHELYAGQKHDFIDAIMLTNHDQNRIASVLSADKKRIKQAAGILLTLPGQPYLYYGEELGMLGTKPDPQIREPFLWTSNPTDPPYVHWLQPMHSTPHAVAPLSEQQKDLGSVWHHYKKLIALRKAHTALSTMAYPSIQPFPMGDPHILAFIRKSPEETLLVIHYLGNKATKLPYHIAQHFSVVFKYRAAVDISSKSLHLKSNSMLILQLFTRGIL